MKKNALMVLCALVFTAISFVACNKTSDEQKTNTEKINVKKTFFVVTTIYPEYAWAKEVVGENADVMEFSLLIKNGVDLHSYKPSAEDVAKLARADMVIYVGGESDEWIAKALEASPKKGRVELNLLKELGDRVKTEEVVDGMQTRNELEEHSDVHEEHNHHEHGDEIENDEHVWLSLKNAEILTMKIGDALAKLDPVHAKLYTQNAQTYVSKLQAIDADYQVAVDSASKKMVLFGDRFPFRYLVDDYGLRYFAAFVGCSAESEASFETIAFLANKMDSEKLPAIFTTEKGNEKIAKAVLSASKNSQNAEILTLNSMQSVTEADIATGVDYLEIMRKNLEILKKAIK